MSVLAEAYARSMGNKAPPQGHNNKKQGKTLQEKRAAKRAKKEGKKGLAG